MLPLIALALSGAMAVRYYDLYYQHFSKLVFRSYMLTDKTSLIRSIMNPHRSRRRSPRTPRPTRLVYQYAIQIH
jgi:hypothetical protein